MKKALFCCTGLLIILSAAGQDKKNNRHIFGVTASLPWLNSYIYHDYDAQKSATLSGFVGFGAALYYKHKNNKVSLNGGFTMDLPVPLGPYDAEYEGTSHNVNAVFFDILYHRNIYTRLNIVGGINMIQYQYSLFSTFDTVAAYMKRDDHLGITAGAEYVSERSFSLALLYRPSLISFDTKQFAHHLSLDIRFNIDLLKSRKFRKGQSGGMDRVIM